MPRGFLLFRALHIDEVIPPHLRGATCTKRVEVGPRPQTYLPLSGEGTSRPEMVSTKNSSVSVIAELEMSVSVERVRGVGCG